MNAHADRVAFSVLLYIFCMIFFWRYFFVVLSAEVVCLAVLSVLGIVPTISVAIWCYRQHVSAVALRVGFGFGFGTCNINFMV